MAPVNIWRTFIFRQKCENAFITYNAFIALHNEFGATPQNPHEKIAHKERTKYLFHNSKILNNNAFGKRSFGTHKSPFLLE